jgi:hypothetical protein
MLPRAATFRAGKSQCKIGCCLNMHSDVNTRYCWETPLTCAHTCGVRAHQKTAQQQTRAGCQSHLLCMVSEHSSAQPSTVYEHRQTHAQCSTLRGRLHVWRAQQTKLRVVLNHTVLAGAANHVGSHYRHQHKVEGRTPPPHRCCCCSQGSVTKQQCMPCCT